MTDLPKQKDVIWIDFELKSWHDLIIFNAKE
jgi:hypothetical protein